VNNFASFSVPLFFKARLKISLTSFFESSWVYGEKTPWSVEVAPKDLKYSLFPERLLRA
jgi:hypothetical protein